MFSSEAWLSNSSNFYNSVATQSLRFDSSSSAYLSRTPSSTSDTKTWVWSGWVKRGNAGLYQTLFMAGTSSTSNFRLVAEFTDSKFQIYYYNGGNKYILPSAVHRDHSAWYHVVFACDTTQTTDSNKLNIYINGEKLTALSTENQPTTDYPTQINSNILHTIGRRTYASDQFFDGYLAEVNFIDGLSFFSDTSGTPNSSFNINSFGELKNGVWIAKAYTGSYGTNGFRLAFNSSDLNVGGSAVTDPYGSATDVPNNGLADASGQGNHWTINGISAVDFVPDSPENNFATLNVLDLRGTVTASEGNLKASIAVNGNITGTIAPTSGKWYWECYLNDITNPYIGVQSVNTAGSASSGYSQDAVALNNGGDIYYDGSSQSGAYEGSPAWTTNDILSVAYDVDNNKIWWALNGQFYSANASSESTIAYSEVEAGNSAYDLSSQITHGVAFLGSSASNGVVTINFGQDGSFAGGLTGGDIGDETDENGIGVFKYAPPSGYLALCTANLPEPTISPNADTQADDHFGTLTYIGNGTDSLSTQDIRVGGTNVVGDIDFKPDWTWIKSKSNTSNHILTDSTRLAGNVLFSNLPNGEADNTAFFTSFETNGFDLAQNGGDTNFNGYTYVAWNWKAGGTAVSNTDGTITSSVSANTDAGFSIVSYTGDGNANATVGHGLDAIPKIIIIKNRDASQDWVVNVNLPTKYRMVLNEPYADSGDFNTYMGTQTDDNIVFGGTNHPAWNGSGNGMIAYCFAEVEGFSKFGVFTGNNDENGTFVFLGFRPAFVMIKSTILVRSWYMTDNTRDVDNGVFETLSADTNLGDATQSPAVFDFLSNGFKLRHDGSGFNGLNEPYIYMAFAENPFKYANAR